MATGSIELLADLIPQLKPFEQRKYLNSALAFIVKQYFFTDHVNYEDASFPSSKTTSGAARLVHDLVKENDTLKDHLTALLSRSSLPALDGSLAARRSVVATVAQDEGEKPIHASHSFFLTSHR